MTCSGIADVRKITPKPWIATRDSGSHVVVFRHPSDASFALTMAEVSPEKIAAGIKSVQPVYEDGKYKVLFTPGEACWSDTYDLYRIAPKGYWKHVKDYDTLEEAKAAIAAENVKATG